MLSGLLVGFLLGFVLQRGRFCVVGAYRDVFLSKKFTIFTALFIVILIQSVGIWILADSGVIFIKERSFFWLATIIGGIIFGFGMVIAGGCATGTWYRASEGLIGSMIALIFYALIAAVAKYGALNGLLKYIQSFKINEGYIHKSLNLSPWILVGIFGIFVGILVYLELRKPRLKIAQIRPRKTGIAHILFEKSWHPFITAIFVAIIAILAWPLSTFSGRPDGLGITTPSANLIAFLVSGNLKFIDWGVFLVLGIALGAFSAAKFSGEFAFRLPDKKTLAFAASGGCLMGLGASFAGGCTIGNGLVQTAVFSYQGWVATIFFLIGAYWATYLTIMKPSRVKN